MDFRRLTLGEVRGELERVGDDVRTGFGTLDVGQLNWRPAASSWSVAQCLDHLVQANREICRNARAAAAPGAAPTLWQRMPGLPALFGRLLITSQSPSGARKFTAPAKARPSASDIDAGILDRFARGQDDVVALIDAVSDRDVDRLIMTSPFSDVITYSVLDGLRIVVAHERRHVEQAERVVRASRQLTP